VGEGKLREMRTLCESLDQILLGQPLSTADYLSQRLKALALAVHDGSWSSARWLELIPSDGIGPAGQEEVEFARRIEARELRTSNLVKSQGGRKSS